MGAETNPEFLRGSGDGHTQDKQEEMIGSKRWWQDVMGEEAT